MDSTGSPVPSDGPKESTKISNTERGDQNYIGGLRAILLMKFTLRVNPGRASSEKIISCTRPTYSSLATCWCVRGFNRTGAAAGVFTVFPLLLVAVEF